MKNQKLFMKKALAVFLASSCIVGLPACSGKNATTTNETSQSQIASETVKETEKKDVELEGKLEKILDDNNIFYENIEYYIDSEELFKKTYEIGVILDVDY